MVAAVLSTTSTQDLQTLHRLKHSFQGRRHLNGARLDGNVILTGGDGSPLLGPANCRGSIIFKFSRQSPGSLTMLAPSPVFNGTFFGGNGNPCRGPE